ncbi:MAG: carbohydrate ABC transporter permease, partial [Caldilineales bacterium]|nr:carbohydrate ABC transporter permease [Caldilineales bacterium]
VEGFLFLLTERAVIAPGRMPERQAQAARGELDWINLLALSVGQEVTGPSEYVGRIINSLIIASGSTFFSVLLGTLSGYAFSRFNLPGKNDLLFFILSTRMLPAVVVTIPLFIMYRQLVLYDTHIGMILLYTVFNLSLAVWLMKGFFDEIPREYEEAALVDGYSRFQAFYKITLPQALSGIAATTVFCLI